MKHALVAMLLAAAAPCPAFADAAGGQGGDRPAPPAPARTGTAKRGGGRLSDKASGERRVDDSKVPEARRTRGKPAACPRDAGS